MEKRWRIVAALLVILATPAAWIFLFDLYVGEIAGAGSEYAARDAKGILLREVQRAQARYLETGFLTPRPPAKTSVAPIIQPLAPRFDPRSDWPTCPEWMLRTEQIKPEANAPLEWRNA